MDVDRYCPFPIIQPHPCVSLTLNTRMKSERKECEWSVCHFTSYIRRAQRPHGANVVSEGVGEERRMYMDTCNSTERHSLPHHPCRFTRGHFVSLRLLTDDDREMEMRVCS